jgi:hypothetical protein
MSWWPFGNDPSPAAAAAAAPLRLTVIDMAGKEYPMEMDQHSTIFDIKREIQRQHPEHLIPLQKLLYRPSKNAKLPNDIPYHPSYNNDTYDKENPYYVLSNKQKISFWNFPQDVRLDLLIDSSEYNPEPILLHFYMILPDSTPLSDRPTQYNPFMFSFMVLPGRTFEDVHTMICRIYRVASNESSSTCTGNGLPNEFTLYKVQQKSSLGDKDELFYKKIKPTDIIDDSYRALPFLYISDAYINKWYKGNRRVIFNPNAYSRRQNASLIQERIANLNKAFDTLRRIQISRGGSRHTRHKRRRNKRSNKRHH